MSETSNCNRRASEPERSEGSLKRVVRSVVRRKHMAEQCSGLEKRSPLEVMNG